MEKYRRVVDQSKRDNIFPEASHIVRVNVSGKLTNYITYAQNRLSDEGPEGGKVELVAIGRAINRAVTVAEILRRNMAGLHQLTVLRSVCTRDTYVPIEEGLKTLELDRTSSCISILLAMSADELDTHAAGYAPPTDEQERTPISQQAIAEMDQDNKSGGSGNGLRRNANTSRRQRRNRPRGRGRRTQKDDVESSRDVPVNASSNSVH